MKEIDQFCDDEEFRCDKHIKAKFERCVYCEMERLHQENIRLKLDPKEYYRGEIAFLKNENMELKKKIHGAPGSGKDFKQEKKKYLSE